MERKGGTMRPCLFATVALYDPATGRIEFDSARPTVKFCPADSEPEPLEILWELEHVLLRGYEAYDPEGPA